MRWLALHALTVADGAQDDLLHPPFQVVRQHDLNAVVSQLEKKMKALAGRVAALEQEKEKAHSIMRQDSTTYNFTLFLHVSGSGGTSFCQLSRRQAGLHAPPYNCELPTAEHGSWVRHLPGRRLDKRSLSCQGLYRTAAFSGGVKPRSKPYNFGMAERPMPHWLECPRVKYAFAMVDPVRRILRFAYEYCVVRTNGGVVMPPTSACDPATTLRRWYAGGCVLERNWTGDASFYGTPAVNDLNVRYLSPAADPYRAARLGADALNQAKQLLGEFALAVVIDSTHDSDAAIHEALGWSGSLPNAAKCSRGAEWKLVKSVLESSPPHLAEHVALVAANNKLDIELYKWLCRGPVINGQRRSPVLDRGCPVFGEAHVK